MKLITTKKAVKKITTNKYKINKYITCTEVITNGKKVYNLQSSFKSEKYFLQPKVIAKKNLKYLNTLAFHEFAYIGYKKDEGITIIEDFNPKIHLEDNIYLFNYAGHMLFDKNAKPITIPYVFDYIGSLKERIPNDPYYKEMIEILKKHPYVLELTEEEIPYYNCDFSGQKGIQRGRVLIPQNIYEKIYKKYKDDEFCSCRIKEDICLCNYKMDFDIYGIKKIWEKWRKQEERHDDDNEY